MKYVKLFENWLNEAEEGATEVKPFDPSKPFDTRIVDISNEDFSKANDEQKRVIIGSILAKCFDKSEKVTDSKIRVSFFTIDEMKTVPGQDNTNNVKFTLKGEDGKAAFITCVNAGKIQDEKSLYVVSMGGEDILTGTYKDTIEQTNNPEKKRIVLFSSGKEGKPEDFVLSSNWTVYDHTKGAKETIIEATLGNVAAFATTKFANTAMLKDANAGNPKNLAKALGYEIPENYAPKQGVEAKK